MATGTMQRPEILLTSPGTKVSVPSWVRKYAPHTATASQVRALRRLPGLTVIQAESPDFVVKHRSFVSDLAVRHERTLSPSKILVVFEARRTPAQAPELLAWLRYFRRFEDVEFAQGPVQAALALQEAVAKLWARLPETEDQAAPYDPLGQVKRVLAATADLRAPSGRLSAKRLSAALGLSNAELAGLLGRKRQTVAKTDDSESLQPLLHPFERIVRLRSVLPEADFRSWLNMPNEQLEGRSPLDAVRQGMTEAVANLAENMLLGDPI